MDIAVQILFNLEPLLHGKYQYNFLEELFEYIDLLGHKSIAVE
jgi:hypothetical protein